MNEATSTSDDIEEVLRSRHAYILVKCANYLDFLREKGIISGGPKVDREKSTALIDAFEAAGNDPMTQNELLDALEFYAGRVDSGN
jgi:hypothetical protein